MKLQKVFVMNFSNETLSVLKNFSTINPSIAFKPGQIVRTISPQKTIMAAATVPEAFDNSAAIYDVSSFLATLQLFDGPDVKFGDDRFTIQGGAGKGQRTVKYTYASDNLIITPPDKDISIPDPEVNLSISWADIDDVIKATGILQLPEVAFESRDGDVYLSAVNSKNPSANTFDILLAEGLGKEDFKMIIKVDNLKLMATDYEVALSSKGMAHFKSEKVQYWIAIESR